MFRIDLEYHAADLFRRINAFLPISIELETTFKQPLRIALRRPQLPFAPLFFTNYFASI